MKAGGYIFREHVADRPRQPLLFVFHGTGGTEAQFFDLGRRILPAAGVVAPRGDVSEMGATRFFKRRAEGLYDMADLAQRTEAMAAFIADKIDERRPGPILGLGYSNGANILASVMMEHAQLFEAVVLMHPLIPFEPEANQELGGRRILITAGENDPICPPVLTRRLGEYFRLQGAEVETAWQAGGHEIRSPEIDAAAAFLAESCASAVAEPQWRDRA